MATQNADWTWDEEILAFDLYLRVGLVGDAHDEVVGLSELLRSLPIHPLDRRAESFRNPNGVARKLSDIHTHRPGYTGKPTNGSKLDAEVWLRYGEKSEEARSIAARIRANAGSPLAEEDDEDEIDLVHQEGRISYRLHRRYERNRRLRQRKLAQAERRGGAVCEACGLNPVGLYGAVGKGVLECHHLLPLAHSGETSTGLDDVALLCPTCHRVAHRIPEWPTVADLRQLLQQGPEK